MTPKEKASDLIKKYERFFQCDNYSYKWAKQAAMVCVDEIIDYDASTYWAEVKKELSE